LIFPTFFSAGIIDTNLNRNIKVSRKLRPENVTEEQVVASPHFLEVMAADAPNVLTNDPQFFTKTRDVRHFDGEMTITNVEWNSDFEDLTNSFLGKMLSVEIEEGLNNILANDEMVNQQEELEFDTKVLSFRPGSVKVLFSIDVSTFDKFSDDFDTETISEAIFRSMETETGTLLGKFLVPR